MLTGFIAAGSPLALLVPTRAWAVDFAALTTSEAGTLLAAARTIAPHDRLDDLAYALVVKAVDSDAAKDPAFRRSLQEGTATLGAAFAKSAEPDRVAALQKIENTPFFTAMRLKTLQVLYSSQFAYAYFGYEGEAFSKGGYVLRGFNDLRWLPEVPLEDSGPLPM